MFKSKSLTPVFLLICISLSLLGFQNTQDQAQEEIRSINREIEMVGGRWKAGETSMTRLTPEERRMRLGYIPPRYEDPERYVKIDVEREIQASLDWRSFAGNFMTVVKNQSSCGSCWAFATVGTMEAIYNIEQGIYEVQPLLSGEQDSVFERDPSFLGQEVNLYERIMDRDLKYRGLFNQETAFSSVPETTPPAYSIGMVFPQLNLYNWIISHNLRPFDLSQTAASSSLERTDYYSQEGHEVSGQDAGLFDGRDIQALSLPDFSEQDLVSCSAAGNCATGGSPAAALNYIMTTGIVTEDCFPYTARDDPCSLCVDYLDKISSIAGWGYVTQATVNEAALIAALQDGPLVGYMEIYSDFYSYSSGIYAPIPSATYEGGHGIVIVGYYDDGVDRYWICKNSWGTGWGDNGYFNIKMGECQIGTWVMKLWGVTINNQPPVLADVSLSIAGQVFKEGTEFSIQLQASDPESGTLTYGVSPLPQGASFNPSTGLFTWTPTHAQGGDYSIRFSVSDGIFEDFQIVNISVVQVKKGRGRF
jgi:C1A family cysteine protease